MKKVLLLILVAFIFSVGMRFTYTDKIKDTDEFKYNNEYIINTNDGYFFGQGAKEIIEKKYDNQTNRGIFDHSAYKTASSQLTALIVKATGLSLDTVMFYISAILSSLIVIPIIMIGYIIGAIEVGFIAALFSSIAWSYYNRTMIGYYDTDMLNIVFPIFMMWSLISSIITKKNIYFLAITFIIIAYKWWYPESYSVEFSIIGMLVLYAIVLYFSKIDIFTTFKNNKNYKNLEFFYISLITYMLIAMSYLPLAIKISIISFLFILYYKKETLAKKILWYLFAFSVLVFAYTGGFDPIMSRLRSYILNPDVKVAGDSLSLHFVNVFTTISEATAIPFNVVADRISGHIAILIASFIGFGLMLIKHRYFILTLPLIILGLSAHTLGLRFTIYAIVPLAFGIAYLIYYIAQYIKEHNVNENTTFTGNRVYFAIMALLTALVLYPNIKHIFDYNNRTTPVFVKSEIKTLDTLKKIANKKDYILSWWDYGYPLKYYSGLNTLVDGGIHHGPDNYPISYLLVQPQEKAAKMARLAVEYHEKRFNLPDGNPNKNRIDIEYMILDNSYKSANKFLNSIEKVKTPAKTRDIYLYFPDRMTQLLHVIEKFSNLNIENGESYQESLFSYYQQYKISNEIVYITRNINIDLKKGIYNYYKQSIPINQFIMTSYNKQGKLVINKKLFDISSDVNVIYMANYHRFLVLNEKLLNSTFIQLYVLENYDKELFEPVVNTPYVKIYKLLK